MKISVTPEQQHALNVVAKCARAHADRLQNSQRIALYEGLALILPEKEAEKAEFLAYAMRKSEDAQMELDALFSAL